MKIYKYLETGFELIETRHGQGDINKFPHEEVFFLENTSLALELGDALYGFNYNKF